MGIRKYIKYKLKPTIWFGSTQDYNEIVITGGNKITSGGYTYHVFVSPGTFETSTDISAELLIVAGGGGGGNATPTSGSGGGGGAGGILNGPHTITFGSYPITVGAGGPNNFPVGPGLPGDPSTAFGFEAIGGGGGGIDVSTTPIEVAGSPGGSGGGGASDDAPQVPGGTGTQAPSGTLTGYGNDGGTPTSNTNDPSSGGGGAGGVGGDGTAPAAGGGNGGVGQAFSSFPGPVVSLGVPTDRRVPFQNAVGPTGLFGGGGGGANANGNSGLGGPGGGGAGGYTVNGGNAVNHTGGGGGGVCRADQGGDGGDGIVVIKYTLA